MKRVAIIQFPGSNCEAESLRAIERNGMAAEEFLWNRPAQELRGFDGFFIVGGFSYEDRSRAGVIASLDPILEQLAAEDAQGKPILGICNGAQILVESGLVPGFSGNPTVLALSRNRREWHGHLLGTGFYNDWTCLRCPHPGASAFTLASAATDLLRVPLAHAEGRFQMSPEVLECMRENRQDTFVYVNPQGETDPHFPVNPNGSVANLAAVCNRRGNVMAMMPHPERTPAGDPIFASMRRFMEGEALSRAGADREVKRPAVEVLPFQPPQDVSLLPVGMIITDNAAKSVEQALRQRGFPVRVSRKVLWSMRLEQEPADWRERIVQSGELLNPNKEFLAEFPAVEASRVSLVVTPRDNLFGEKAVESIRDRYGWNWVKDVEQSMLWTLDFDNETACHEGASKVIESHLLHSPVADRIFAWTGGRK